jgi:hypothetical protein
MGIGRWWQRRRRRRPSVHLAAASSSTGDVAPVTGPITGPVAVVEVPVSTELLAPIAGVTVEQYVLVSKGVAAHNYDQAKLPLVAAELGIDAAAWATAAAGFNARVSSSPAFARHFNTLYRAARPRAS